MFVCKGVVRLFGIGIIDNRELGIEFTFFVRISDFNYCFFIFDFFYLESNFKGLFL